MASGKVKWWDNKKGFGFIAQESGQDVFVHHTAIVGTGAKPATELTFKMAPHPDFRMDGRIR